MYSSVTIRSNMPNAKKKNNKIPTGPCGKCGVPCLCSSSGPKNANCQCNPQPPEQTVYTCGCSPPQPQPEPQPKKQSEACECGCNPSQPKLQIGACTCGCSAPEPQPEPMQRSEDCACDSSPLQPQPKSKRQSEAGACACSPPQQKPKSKRQSACKSRPCACDSSPPQPPEPIRIPCSPQVISGVPRKVYCQCNRSAQSQPNRQSGPCACGSSALNKSWQNSDAQPLAYCQCNQSGKPEKKERVPALETYVCYQPSPQPEVQDNNHVKPTAKCKCNAPDSSPYPEPRESYGLASVKSPPEPIGHQQQVPKKSQGPQPIKGKEKKKKCTIQ